MRRATEDRAGMALTWIRRSWTRGLLHVMCSHMEPSRLYHLLELGVGGTSVAVLNNSILHENPHRKPVETCWWPNAGTQRNPANSLDLSNSKEYFWWAQPHRNMWDSIFCNAPLCKLLRILVECSSACWPLFGGSSTPLNATKITTHNVRFVLADCLEIPDPQIQGPCV